jgi:hypothetical protein
MGAVAGIGGAMAGAAGAAASNAELGNLIKAKTEDTFEYRLMTPISDTPVPSRIVARSIEN